MDSLEKVRINKKLRDSASIGDYRGVKKALDNGADVDDRDCFGTTALMNAVDSKLGHPEQLIATIELLIEKGADVNARNNLTNDSLCLIIQKPWWYAHHVDLIEILVKNGADVFYAVDRSMETALALKGERRKEWVRHVKVVLEKKSLRGLKQEIRKMAEKEKDPVKRLELRIKLMKIYKKFVSMLSRKSEIGNLKTVKPPRRDARKWRTGVKRVRNG